MPDCCSGVAWRVPMSGTCEEMTDETALERGRRDYRRQAWSSACAALTAADQRSPIAVDDLELLATAGYLAGEDVRRVTRHGRAPSSSVSVTATPAGLMRCAFWIDPACLTWATWRGRRLGCSCPPGFCRGRRAGLCRAGAARYLGRTAGHLSGVISIAAAAWVQAAAAAVGVRFGDAGPGHACPATG